ncbi:MAG: glycogen-binding domain-containing protein [Balneolaceae bacterium]
MIILSILSNKEINAQNLDAFITIDSRAGFSTNTFLNPFLAEWDRTENSGYAMVSPLANILVSSNRFAVDFTGGFVFEPFFDGRDTWHGGLLLADARYRIGNSITAGVETGGSYFTSFFTRQLYWVQPKISWSPSLFTRLSFKAGPTFRDYENFREEDLNDRIDLYALEFETWPALNWQLTGGIFGNFATSISDNLSSRFSVTKIFDNSFRLSVRGGIDQFKNEIITGTNGPGGPPFGGFRPVTTTEEETDVLLRAGLAASYELFSSFSITTNLDFVNLQSTGTPAASDVHFSAGVRYTFPLGLSSGGGKGASPKWEKENNSALILNINYKGNGRLFLTGDFNGWEKPGIPLIKQKQKRYAAQISLDSGAYEYKILLIEGDKEEWVDFTPDTFTVNDGFGGENGLIIIE